MRAHVTLAVLAVAAAAVGVPAVVADAGAQQSHPSTAPGSRLAGVIGVQEAEVSTEVESRAFEARLSGADSNASKAAVVAERVGASRERLAAARARLDRLREMRANGTIGESEYRARVATVAASVAAVRSALNRTESAARGLPAAALERRGVNATAIQRLRADADEMTGPEVAEIARSIAGRGAGARATGPPPGVGPPAERGSGGPPGDDATNRSGDAGDRGPPDDRGDADGEDRGDGRSGNRGGR